MSRETYVILRTDSVDRADPVTGMTIDKAVKDVEVKVENLEEREAVELGQSDKSVAEIGRAMPMRLVQPADNDDMELDPAEVETWGLRAVGADNSDYTGKGVTVGILDTGIDEIHPAFAGIELTRKDYTDEGHRDEIGHGTHCAGTIFGRDVGGQRIGVARGVERAVIAKVLRRDGRGSTEHALEAIWWAAQEGAQIISMSVSIDFPGYREHLVQTKGYPKKLATSKALVSFYENIRLFEHLAALLEILPGNQTLLIGSAGNDSARYLRPDFGIGAAVPAAARGVIAVGSLGRNDDQTLSVADDSNSNVAVAGPGVGIWSAKAGGGLACKSGTSMAAPHVAGVAALWAEEMNSPIPSSLGKRVVGRATYTGLAADYDAADVGSGLVQAP